MSLQSCIVSVYYTICTPTEMTELVNELAETLGTAELVFSSEPALGSRHGRGVARPKGSLSALESNGIMGRIHVSESTADALRRSGKSAWLEPWAEKIAAKGKEELQTYFVNPSVGTFRTGSVASSAVPSSFHESNDNSLDAFVASDGAVASTTAIPTGEFQSDAGMAIYNLVELELAS